MHERRLCRCPFFFPGPVVFPHILNYRIVSVDVEFKQRSYFLSTPCVVSRRFFFFQNKQEDTTWRPKLVFDCERWTETSFPHTCWCNKGVEGVFAGVSPEMVEVMQVHRLSPMMESRRSCVSFYRPEREQLFVSTYRSNAFLKIQSLSVNEENRLISKNKSAWRFINQKTINP